MLVFAQVQHLQIQANTNTNLQIQANTNTNLQIQACLTLSVCLEHGQVAECEQRPFKERFNVTLYKPQFFPLRLYARLYAWVLLPYSWKTKTNSSLKVKTLVSWWLMSVKQGGKRHWRVEILCSTGLSPYLVIKNITDMISMAIKKCSSYAVWQWKRLSRKVLRDICLVLVLLLKWGWQWGEHMSEQLFDQGFFHWQKIQIFFCTNTLNNLQKYKSRRRQRGERLSEQLFDQDFLFRFLRR